MNKNKLTSLCHKISNEKGLSFNSVMTYYFLERILLKLSLSDERNNFIFKGGFLLSNVLGIEQRSTVDMDFLIKDTSLNSNNIEEILNKILTEDEDVKYKINRVEEIRPDDEYGGFRFSILCTMENIRQIVPLDIATGDPITPKEMLYSYKSIFKEEEFDIFSYNIETILAEKIQTIYKRGIFNSRSKDFYDLYLIYKIKKDDIDYEIFKSACSNTFIYRKTELDYKKIIQMLNTLKNEKTIEKRWMNYSNIYSFTRGITLDEVIDGAINLINRIEIEG